MATIHVMAGEPKAAMLALRVEKPPVEMVAKEWDHGVVKVHARQTQSHDLRRRQTNVDAIEHLGGVVDMGQQLALDRAGAFGPHQVYGPRPVQGIRARNSTSTPMPPIHWVSARQKRIPLGMASTSVRMVAPVVVRPEAVSNRASA